VSFFWAVFASALACGWLSFAHLIHRGSVVALIGSVAAFIAGAVLFGFVWYTFVIYVHTYVFGGTI